MAKIKKVVFIGEKAVGKEALIRRYIEDSFVEQHITTIGIDFRSKDLMDTHGFSLQIWFRGGSDRFRAYRPEMLYNRVGAIVLVYDITSKNSFDALEEERKYLADNYPDVPLILIGNKTDLNNQREVPAEEAKAYADLHSMSFLEMSAKDDVNVQELFNSIIDIVKQQPSAELGGNDDKHSSLNKIRSYVDTLSQLNVKLPSKNDKEAGMKKAERLEVLFGNGKTPSQEQLEAMLRDTTNTGVIFNRSVFGPKFFRAYSKRTHSYNPVLNRPCESTSEQLLAKYYNETFKIS